MNFFSRTPKAPEAPRKAKIEIPEELRTALERGDVISEDMRTKFMPLVEEKLPDKAELVRTYLVRYNTMSRLERLGLARLVLKFVGG
jgi:hypothetical protein